MTVRRIVTNIAAEDLAKAKRFYGDLLGLDMLMDHAGSSPTDPMPG